MSLNKSFVVARTDLKAAMQVKFVKYGLLGLGALGPISAVATVVSIVVLLPPGPDAEMLLAYIGPTVASLLMMFGIIPASMISANALVGEREQKTLEPLLATPLTDRELLIGKVLSSLIPSSILLLGGTLVSIIAENIIFALLGYPFYLIPDMMGIFMIVVGGLSLIIAVVCFMIVISGRVSRVYEAYQTTSVVVLIAFIPMILPLMFIESGLEDAVLLSSLVTVLLSVLLMVALFFLAITRFNRDRLISMV